MDRTDQAPRAVTPAPAGIYPNCDCGQEATPGHVCPSNPAPAPKPDPVPSPKALAALYRLETWAAYILRDRQEVTV